MNEIRSLLNVAARRLELSSLLSKAHLVVIAAAALSLLMLLAERLGEATFVPWRWVLPAVTALAAIVAARMWLSGRRSELQVAVEVDDRLDLRERLSTALHVHARSDAFARAAVGDAVETASDPRVREQVRRRFAIVAPLRWWISPLLVAFAVGLSFVPPLDLFSREATADPDVGESVAQSDAAIRRVLDPINENPMLRDELDEMLDDLAAPIDPAQIKDRKDAQRTGLKKLTDVERALREITDGPKGKTAEALERALERLKAPLEGPAKDLAEAMAKGEFKAAQEALQKLIDDARNGKLNAQDQAQLAAQLQDLAAQLDQLAKQQQQLEDVLKQAGMDPQLAANPQALQQAIQNNPNLNQQQRQQLQQMAQAQQQACQVCQGLGNAMQQFAQQMGQAGQMGQQGQQGQGQQGQMQPGVGQGQMGQGLQDQLNQLEMIQQMLKQAQAAANACQGQCQGIGQGLGLQQALRQGGAFGNRGQGQGGKAPISPTPTGTKTVKADGKVLPGDVIAREFFEGQQITGESTVKLRQVLAALAEGYDEAQSDEQLPRKYHDTHKHYFGEYQNELRKRAEPAGESGPPAPPANETKPGG